MFLSLSLREERDGRRRETLYGLLVTPRANSVSFNFGLILYCKHSFHHHRPSEMHKLFLGLGAPGDWTRGSVRCSLCRTRDQSSCSLVRHTDAHASATRCFSFGVQYWACSYTADWILLGAQ